MAFDTSATYSPEDDKLRIYSVGRFPRPTYERLNSAGFRWAPQQKCFFATWTPERQALALELAGEIDEAEGARRRVRQIMDGIPMGQPILIGHHSERAARADARRIDDGMRKAVSLWETSAYWKARAAGALRHARYKERSDVRARRIARLEGDRRRMQRHAEKAREGVRLWSVPDLSLERALFLTGQLDFCFPLAHKAGDQLAPSAWGILSKLASSEDLPGCYAPRTFEEVVCAAVPHFSNRLEWAETWIAHLDNRLTYERAMLGDEPPPKPKATRPPALPLLNYSGTVRFERYGRMFESPTVSMTKAEYAAIGKDFKGTLVSADGTHRVRSAVVNHGSVVNHGLRPVFLTDCRVHDVTKAGSRQPPGITPIA